MWLKKGYDFVRAGRDFNSPDAVVDLGVGKNMVASIRYWLKSFGLYDGTTITPLANYLFDDQQGKDIYLEDIASLQLLHFTLVHRGEATLYPMLFCGLQRERSSFDREQALSYVALRMAEDGKQKLFNANTVKKDIAVLLQNYSLPRKPLSNEDFSSLMIDLDLIRQSSEDKDYYFNHGGKRQVVPEVFLYALLTIQEESGDRSLPFETVQDNIGLVFCMDEQETVAMLRSLSEAYSTVLSYSDVAGIRQIQFTGDADRMNILDDYYDTHH